MRKTTELVVIHRTEVESDFSQYHFVVLPDGRIHYATSFLETASHALNYNSRSIGLAFFGNFASAERSYHPTPSQAQIDAGRDLVRLLNWWYGKQLPLKGHSELGSAGTRYPEKLVAGHDCPGSRGNLIPALKKALGYK